ncbi:aldehyde dehydrogenase (NAD) domain protein [Burkholderia multivorans ATCC BAA-247]|nr:aldehyde dehydrogenase (NAD) domain protein [Burkholderia multivorans ATCC BAA-247]
MTRFSLELGGKNPIVMLDDVDVGQALDGVAAGAFFNQGQVCAAASRIYVHRSKFAQLANGLAEHARAMTLGAGLDTTAQINPLVSPQHRDKVVRHIEQARRDGVTFLAGGTRVDELPGYYVRPAVIADPRADSAIVRDEVFGPVIVVLPFDDAADAVRLANASPYGLAASIWSNDLTRVMNLVPQIEAGTVWVNCHIPLDPSMPFGGYKQSGIGREFGQYAIEGFTETKSVCIAH